MANGDFLAKIKLALEGKNQVVSGLKETQKAAQQLSKTKVTTVFDKEGLATGKKIEETFQGVGKESKASFQNLNDFSKALQRAAIVAPVWMALRSAMQGVIQLVQSQIKFLLDLEDAMARIQIVGQGTKEQFDNLKTSLVGLSVAYGISSSEALNAAKIFAQQGKTISETFVLTRTAMIGAQVLGQDVATTVEDMTAAMNAFNIPAQNATSIIEKFIAVEKAFAVTSKDLSEGVKVVGATANQVGVTLSALSGDITAVIEVTRKSGSEAARGLQFIYARLLTSAKPVIQQLTGIKFNLDANGEATDKLTGTLRSATDILDELASKWGTLTNEEKLNIATSVGSKRQLVVLNALMQNYTRSLDARVVALTSAGQSERALGILMETTRFKAQQTAAAMNALTLAVGDTGAWKGLLDSLTTAALFYTKLISFEKGYRIELAKESAAQFANIETRQTQISNIEELIKLRDKLASAGKSDENIKRLELINKAIAETVKNQPTLKLALESGNIENFTKTKKDIEDKLLREKITIQVGVDFLPKLAALDKRKGELEESLSEIAPVVKPIFGKKALAEVLSLEEKRKKLLKEQREESEKQFILAKSQKISKELEDEEELAIVRGELTAKEKEELDIERQINNFKILGEHTTEEQLNKEIELVKASQNVYDAHQKTLKISQLENQVIDARLKKRDEEITRIGSLALQFEKASKSEQKRITRAAELSLMEPERLASIFQGQEGFLGDKQIILDFWTSFSKEAQTAIEQSSTLFKELFIKLPKISVPNAISTTQANSVQQTQKPITNTVIGAQIQDVNINLPNINLESLADQAGQKLAERLKSDEEFQKLIAKGIRNKL